MIHSWVFGSHRSFWIKKFPPTNKSTGVLLTLSYNTPTAHSSMSYHCLLVNDCIWIVAYVYQLIFPGSIPGIRWREDWYVADQSMVSTAYLFPTKPIHWIIGSHAWQHINPNQTRSTILQISRKGWIYGSVHYMSIFFVPPSENPPYLQVFQCRIFLEIACASLPSVLEIPNGNTGSLCPSVAW